MIVTFRHAALLLAAALLIFSVNAACAGGVALAGENAFVAPGGALVAPGLQRAPLPFAMGGRDDAALEARESGQASSPVERLFSGSFLGALLFGYPYSGMGAVDIGALFVLGFLLFRAFAARSGKKEQGRDRFTVHARKEHPTDIPDEHSGQGRRDGGGRGIGRAGPAERPDDWPSANPHDNPWSRRTGGAGGTTPENSPWRGQNGDNGPSPQRPAVTKKERAAAMWAYLSSEGGEIAPSSPAAEAAVAEGARVPDGFDVPEFLDGARILYSRLQESWAKRELGSLENFLTPDMMALLRKQKEKDPEPVGVDVLLVEAALKDVDTSGGGEDARVLFKALIRTGDAAEPAEVHEEWRFHRGADSDGMWRLAGIRGA